MKAKILAFCIIVLSIYSCNKTDSLGIEIQPQGDKITVVADTFYLPTKDSLVDAISAQCIDSMSMILGEYQSPKYGDIKADLILQFTPSIGYQFPPNTYDVKADSLMLYILYGEHFGSDNEPMEISVYELNKSTPDYNTQYLTNLDVTQFLDINSQQFIGSKIFTPISYKDSVRKKNNYIAIKFPEAQLNRFFDLPNSVYSSIEAFLTEFKGLFLTSSYGKSNIVYLSKAELRLFYHYSYKTKNDKGNDTTIKVNTYLQYPASKDVRQLNIIKHSNIEDKINKRDSINYITSASGIYPRVSLPIAKIKQRIKDSIPNKDIAKQIFINSANVSLELTEIDSTKGAEPIPTNIIMLPVSEAEQFIKNSSISVIEDYKAQTATFVPNTTKGEYSIDIAYLLNKVIKDQDNSATHIDYLLIPVDIYLDKNQEIKEIRPSKRISASTIRSGQNQYSPLRLELVFTGLN